MNKIYTFSNHRTTDYSIKKLLAQSYFAKFLVLISLIFDMNGNLWGQCAAYTTNTACTTTAPTVLNASISCTPVSTNGGRRNFVVTNMVAGYTYRVSNCGSGYDTQMTIRDASAAVVGYNDDAGPACTGSAASIDFVPSTGGTYRIQLNRFNCATTTALNGTITVTLTACPGPVQPSSITGTLNPEPGASQVYSVTNVSGVTYTWLFPSGWNITAGQGTNSVTVTVGSVNGTISVTPSSACGNGTAQTATTTIPNYRWKYISSNLGSATWTGGEARNVSITIQNTGVGTWNSGVTTNAAIRWDSDNLNAAFSPWTDYHSRITTGIVSPGSQVTCTLPIQSNNATSGPTYSTNLADGTYYLAFDLVNEGSCWFGGAAGGTGPCTAGNAPWYSSAQTVSTTPIIGTNGTLTQFGACVSSASSEQTFSVSGVNLSANLIVTAPAGYEVSITSGSGFGSYVSLTPSSGTISLTTIYARMAAVGSTPASGNITCTCTGATTQNVAVSATQTATTTNAGTVSPNTTQTICSGQSISFTGGGSPSVNFGLVKFFWYLAHDIDGVGSDWVDWQEIGTSASLSVYNPQTLPVFANSSKFLFVRRVVSSCGTQGIPDYASQDHYIEVNVNPSPTLPTASNPADICIGQSTNIVATSTAGSGINWFSSPSGGSAINPSLLACGANYSVSPASSTTYYAEATFNVSSGSETFNYSGSIVNWTVPVGVTSINVDARGAKGGAQPEAGINYGGRGARIVSNSISVTPGQVLKILVGQAGTNGISDDGCGGGGGTFLTTNTNTPLVVAGGGGGDGADAQGINASTTTTPSNNSYGNTGGTSTNGGTGYNGGGGAGLTGNAGNGGNGAINAGGGLSFTNGGTGGTGLRNGGFGGGGSGSTDTEGAGGGGGYAGGAGGNNLGSDAGGGGSSYSIVSPTTAAATQTGNGQIIISWNAVSGCSSATRTAVTVTVNPLPTAPTASVSGASTVNVGGSATLTSTAGANTVWYVAATGGASIGTGSPFTSPVQCATGSVTYYAEDNNGTCASNSRGAVSFTVRSMVAENPSNALICSSGGSVTLSAQLTGGSSIAWSPNTNLSATSGASTVASPTATTVYTMSATVAGCGSVSETATVGVIDAVAFTPTSTPASVCAGNPAALASNLASSGFTYATTTFGMASPSSPTNLVANGATGVALASGTLDDGGWQNIPIGFTYNFFGNNYTTINVGTNGVIQFGAYNATSLGDFTYATAFPTATEPTNIIAAAANDYYAYSGTIRYWTQGIAPTRTFVTEWNGVPGYTTNGSMTVQVKLFETTGIVEIHVQNASSTNNKVVGLQNADASVGATAYSNTATITNTAWKFIPGANYTFQWATAGSNIGGETATSYTTPNLSTPGTVTYNVAATNPNTNCTTTQSVNITVNALPSAPNTSGDVTACSTLGNQNLAVTTGAGETADWFAASTGGTVLASGDNVLSYSTATAATYYAAAQNTTTGCSSATRTGVTLNVNTSPNAPTVTTPVAYCQGAPSIALTATATGANTLNWYSAAPSYPAVTGATALGSAPTPSTSTAGTTNYYVSQSSSANSCESQLALVAVTVNATPSAPVASAPAAYCQSASASALTATATAGNTLYWYTVPTGGTGSATAPTPSTATAGTTDYYVADKTDASGCEGSRTTVTVTVSPTITASVTNSASSTSACGGGAITFTATPTNGGTPTYQWYLNSASVSGATNATYTLATPNDADAIYVEMTPSAQTCLASSAATNSNTIPLTSTAATPTVSIQSTASTAFCPGTSVTFSVNASANMGASPTYQWNLNGTPIGGSTSATLVNTTLANNDQVTLTMTSSLGGACLTQSGATSSAITSTVNSVTAISTQPSASAACLGESTSFTVSATGTGTLTYQWKKNGSNVTGNASATTSTLTLSGIAAGDADNYTVNVTGTCGAVLSSSAALTINTATAISSPPSVVTQCAGTTANFSVSGSGQGTLTYQWRKDGSALNGETNSTLAVTNIATINAGQYSVIMTGGCGNVTSSNALLTVNSSTSISTQPAASTLCAGNTVNFSVTASGTGTLSYQWKKDGTNVGTNSAALSVSNTQAVNAGTYTVDVTGTCGILTSNNALLTVNPLTTISTQPVGTSGCEGQNTTFTVVAAGTGSLSYQWKYGATNVGTNSASYNIPSTSNANDGNYSVVVTGTCGNTTSSTVALNVYLSPTTNATISTADITDATLCGKNTVAVVANSPGAESVGSWSVVGGFDITPANASATSTTFTAASSALGGQAKKLVWSHTRETNGNFCYTRDTLTVDFKQPSTTGTTASFTSNCYLWCGLTDANWSTSSNWYSHTGNGASGRWEKVTTGEPTTNSNVFILNNANDVCVNTSNIPTLGNGEVTNNVFNAQGAELNLSNGNLTLTGNFTNNGTINPGTGTVTFNGTGAQKIRGSGAIANLNNVIVNKASGTLTLEQPTRINGNLTVSNGNIVTTNTNVLEIGSSVSSTGSVTWTAGSVQGPIKRWFGNTADNTTESGIFPVGTATHNRNATINFTSNSAGGYIIVNFISGLPTATENPFNLPISYFANGSNNYIQNADVTGYWEITPYNAGGTAYGAMDNREYSISLRINNTGALIANPVTANPPGMRLLKAKGYVNGSHDPFTIANANATVTAIGGSQTDFNVTCSNISGFSFFGMGGDNETPLPVELLSFTGFCDENQTTINWKTASEFNSSYYVVAKSTDGENWREVNNQPAAGFSNEELSYQFIDESKNDDNVYYRLSQFDSDGEATVYNPIFVSCDNNSNFIKTLPNPSDASFQVLVNNKLLIGKATIKMIDTKGTLVSIKEVEITEGTNLFYLNENVTPGIYYLSISNGINCSEVIKHSVK